MNNATNNNTTDGINFDVMIADLKSSLERQAEWLDMFGPNNGVVSISDGDFLVSVNGEEGPFAKFEVVGKELRSTGKNDLTLCIEHATTMNKATATIIVDDINTKNSDRDHTAAVVKFGRAKQWHYEENKRALSVLEEAQAEYLARTADEC